MLWPGIKKLGKELHLKRTDSEVTGIIKSCFVKMYDGRNMKILELYVPEMNDDDKNNIVKKLEAEKIKKIEWVTNGIKITFVEMFKPYSIKKIKGLLEELINYFSNKYPAQSPKCQHCDQQNETDVYSLNDASMLLCYNCYRQIENNTKNENIEQQNTEGNYLQGFFGALLFTIPGIILTILLFVFLNLLTAISTAAYVFLGIFGYKKFKGKISPAGAVIIILTALIMIAFGVTAAYSVLIFKEIKMINFDMLKYFLNMPEIREELIKNIAISYGISALYIVFQFHQIFKGWKNQKTICKPREIL